MDTALYDIRGEAVAFLHDDYHNAIYLWDGRPAAYLYDEQHVYGMNGRHLGWFVDGILFNIQGDRIGFVYQTCPVKIAKKPVMIERRPVDEIQPRWKAPPFPKLTFNMADQSLVEFLEEGMLAPLPGEKAPETSSN